jgi:DNA-binding NarL/FixJ family response regulator
MRQRYSFASILVGKNSLRREGLARILSSANFRIVASLSCADDLLSCKTRHSQLLFLLVHTGQDFDAVVEQIELFKERFPDARIVIVADDYRLNEMVLAFRAGAAGYFVDVMRCDVFIKSVELVMMGEIVFPPEFLLLAIDAEGNHPVETSQRDDKNRTVDAAEDGGDPQLSPREKSILLFLIEGDSNKCIARKIDIAEATVKVHIKAILRKIRVQNRTQAAIWGINNRSLAKQSGNRPAPPNAGEAPPNAVRDIPDIMRIDDAVPLGVITHTPNEFEASLAGGHIRKAVNARANGAIRLRK